MKIENEKILRKLCFDYNFKLSTMGEYITIKSKNDLWYVQNLEFHNGYTKIKLLHANQWGSGGYHSQGKFNNHEDMFRAIYKHDNKYNIHFKGFENLEQIKIMEVV